MEKALRKAAGMVPVLLVLAIMGCASVKAEAPNTPAGYIADTGMLEARNSTSVDMAIFAGRVEQGIFLGAVSELIATMVLG
ncbi:hypothetical protein FACS189483_11230 [Spirochaetia bacterium]|nr:hypothetical protein FACS189483_11230 [Spirochaetia bacterium]